MRRATLAALLASASLLLAVPARCAVGPHTDHSLSAGRCLNATCHTELGRSRYLHGPVAAGNCDPCHPVVFWHEGKHPQLSTRVSADVCLYCHEEARQLMRQQHVHTPVAHGECIKCHEPHRSDNFFMLRVPGGLVRRSADLCLTCHDRANPRWRTGFHGATSLLDCVQCHDPHASPDRFQLTRYVRTVYVRDYLSLAQEDFQNKRYKDALENVGYVLQVEPRDATALVIAVRSHLLLGDLTRSSQFLEQLHAVNPRNAEAFYLEGALQAARGEDFKAMATFNQSLSLNPESAETLLALARLQLKHGLDLDATANLVRTSLAAPDDPAVWLALSQAYERQGRKSEADKARARHRALLEKK